MMGSGLNSGNDARRASRASLSGFAFRASALSDPRPDARTRPFPFPAGPSPEAAGGRPARAFRSEERPFALISECHRTRRPNEIISSETVQFNPPGSPLSLPPPAAAPGPERTWHDSWMINLRRRQDRVIPPGLCRLPALGLPSRGDGGSNGRAAPRTGRAAGWIPFPFRRTPGGKDDGPSAQALPADRPVEDALGDDRDA